MSNLTPEDAVQILTLMSVYDGRPFGETDAVAWADILGDIPLKLALDVVREHYQTQTRRIMPADILLPINEILGRPARGSWEWHLAQGGPRPWGLEGPAARRELGRDIPPQGGGE